MEAMRDSWVVALLMALANAIVPIYVIIFLGYFSSRLNLFTEHHIQQQGTGS
jgi:predicted permease